MIYLLSRSSYKK